MMPGARGTPAKVVIERRVHPGAERAFSEWAERFVASASSASGHEGASVLSARGVSVILLRFATEEQLEQWRNSTTFAELMRRADTLSASGDAAQVRSGMETWFTLPDMPAPAAPPPKWKMALLTWACLLPMVIGLKYLLSPLALPYPVNAALSTAIPVSLLTWVIMPRLTRALYGWLYTRTPPVDTHHSIA